MEQVGHVGLELSNGIGVGGVEGQGDHGLHLVQLHGDHPVVIRALRRGHLPVAVPPAQQGEGGFGVRVGLPDGGQAGGLGGHHVDAGAVVHGEGCHAGAEELQYGIFHRAGFKGGPHQGQSHVLGPHSRPGRAGEVDGDDVGVGDVVGLAQQLPGQLRAALADGHTAVSPVSGMGIGAQNHPAGSGVALPHVGMDDRLVGGDELAAVLFGGRQAEHVVVLIDGAAHGAQGVVAVGEHIGQGEFFHAGGPGGLDDAHIGDIMGGHGVEADGQAVRAIRGIVGHKDGVGHGALPALRGGGGGEAAVLPADRGGLNGNHIAVPPVG